MEYVEEFLRLGQSGRTVTEYEIEFTRLSRLYRSLLPKIETVLLDL